MPYQSTTPDRAAFEEDLRRNYATTPNTILRARWNVSKNALAGHAHRLGLKKNREWKESKESAARAVATRRARGTLLKGERHPSWKGGRPWERFKNPDYIAWRNAVLERDGYTCQDCQRVCKKRETGLAAHHIKPFATHPDDRYSVENGQTLCNRCHMRLHGREPRPVPRIPCACGCGTMIDAFDKYGGRPRLYVNHHASKGKPKPESMKRAMSEQRTGVPHTPEHKAKIAAGLQRAQAEGRRVGGPLGERAPAEERFWEKVTKDGPIPATRPDLGPCWLWTGALHKKYGYGHFLLDGAQTHAHRAAYALLREAVPAGRDIVHLCHNRGCVNPQHLEAVTPRERLLRGDRSHVGRWQRQRTHCPQGHPYDAENTRYTKTGGRYCAQCSREQARRRIGRPPKPCA